MSHTDAKEHLTKRQYSTPGNEDGLTIHALSSARPIHIPQCLLEPEKKNELSYRCWRRTFTIDCRYDNPFECFKNNLKIELIIKVGDLLNVECGFWLDFQRQALPFSNFLLSKRC